MGSQIKNSFNQNLEKSSHGDNIKEIHNYDPINNQIHTNKVNNEIYMSNSVPDTVPIETVENQGLSYKTINRL